MFFCKRNYSRYLYTEDKSIKALFFELNLHKEMSCDSVLRIIILSADFKVNINDHCVEFFCDLYRFRSLIKDSACCEISRKSSKLILAVFKFLRSNKDWTLRLS